MLKRFKELEPALALLAANDRTINALYPDDEDWRSIKDTLLLLEPLERATKYLSALSYPIMGDTRLIFLGFQSHLEKHAKDNNFSQRTMATLISRKIEDY
ncbi:hypothetical protein C1645_837898 [Glomus cerebriforme]|uniref:Uncharacterized protein n=1 Tax=Glomus cerebriforme TaxID=658196 RepID=A0A397S816_9GLOM|nr:hypothetical protein C1645_837898 [Glomus cerebriforme]